MKSLTSLAVALGVMGISQAQSTTTADGFADFYLQQAIGRPTAGTSLGTSGRLFDPKLGSFTLTALRVNLKRETTSGGATVRLLFGENADLLHAYEPGKDKFKMLQEAFSTWKTGPLQVDAGKFAAWIGYEALDSVGNENYSRSFNFNLGQPNYTLGIRMQRPISTHWSLRGYVVNGYNETEDSNDKKRWERRRCIKIPAWE